MPSNEYMIILRILHIQPTCDKLFSRSAQTGCARWHRQGRPWSTRSRFFQTQYACQSWIKSQPRSTWRCQSCTTTDRPKPQALFLNSNLSSKPVGSLTVTFFGQTGNRTRGSCTGGKRHTTRPKVRTRGPGAVTSSRTIGCITTLTVIDLSVTGAHSVSLQPAQVDGYIYYNAPVRRDLTVVISRDSSLRILARKPAIEITLISFLIKYVTSRKAWTSSSFHSLHS